MRHQERNVSEFDEIITYPPSAAPSGEKQVMSCVQAFTAALGFAMSAGWDWLPSMHRLWLRDYIEAVSMPTPFGFFGTLSGSIFFKMIMLLALCPVMERLFLAFPLDRVAFRRKPFPNADYALIPPAIRERIYLSTPLILAQLCAILLTNAARDLAQFSARFGTPLTCASIVLAHCMQRARRKISRLSAFRLSELHAYSRYHFWASCSGTSPYSPLSDSKSQIPLFNFFARPI